VRIVRTPIPFTRVRVSDEWGDGIEFETPDFEPPTEDAIFVFVDWERDHCVVTWRIP
jgi:hypothetical protein